MGDIGVRAPSDLAGGEGGGATILPEKNYPMPENHVLYKRTQIPVKTKTFTILTSNERIIIPKLHLNPDFSNLQEKRKLVRKIGYFEKSEVTKITVFDRGEGNDFCFELSGGSRNRDSTVVILKPGILYDFDRLPSKSKTYKRNST